MVGLSRRGRLNPGAFVGVHLASDWEFVAMNREASLVASLALFWLTVPAHAQFNVNPTGWMEKDGLTVASAQQVNAKPTKLRLFATLEARDKDVRRAVSRLADKKKSAGDKLRSLDPKPIALTFSPSRILEWTKISFLWWSDDDEYAIQVPDEPANTYTAYAAVQVDWELKDQASDELILVPIDLMGRIRGAGVFTSASSGQTKVDTDDSPSEIYMVFVGEISEEAGTEATKRAHEEANGQALKIASVTNRSLGKLLSMTPRVDGAWSWWWGHEHATKYPVRNSDKKATPHPMSEFRHLPSEVFGANPADLHRTYSVDLRFELK